jgi:hypothetical protein
MSDIEKKAKRTFHAVDEHLRPTGSVFNSRNPASAARKCCSKTAPPTGEPVLISLVEELDNGKLKVFNYQGAVVYIPPEKRTKYQEQLEITKVPKVKSMGSHTIQQGTKSKKNKVSKYCACDEL